MRSVSRPTVIGIMILLVIAVLVTAMKPVRDLVYPFLSSPGGLNLIAVLCFTWLAMALIEDYHSWNKYGYTRRLLTVISWLAMVGFALWIKFLR